MEKEDRRGRREVRFKGDLRIVLLGKTGAGKSSAGNTILGRKAFPVSPTTECKKETGEFEGLSLAVVDTPGLMNNRLTEEQVKREIRTSISLAAPGPHVFLMVIHAGRFTKEEQEAMKTIQQMFGDKAAASTMVLFTRGDDIEADEADIDKIINDNSALTEFIHQCHGEYHVFNNRDKNPAQVRELLNKINTMVKNKEGRCYTEDMFREAERARTEEMKRPQRENPVIDPVMPEDPKRWFQRERSSHQMDPAALVRGAGEAGKQELRIVLVGKTGVGKTASGNTILGRKAFQSNLSATTECQRETGEFEGQSLAVADTPGLLNTRLTEEQVMTEISRCFSLAAPGPHVLLIVLQGGRFIEEDQEIVKNLQKMLGKEAAHYTMVLFTCGGDLEADGDTIEDIICNDKDLNTFINQCHQQYHVFENRNKDPSQVRELLEKINEMVQINRGRYYSTEMFREAERAMREEMTSERKSTSKASRSEKSASWKVRKSGKPV